MRQWLLWFMKYQSLSKDIVLIWSRVMHPRAWRNLICRWLRVQKIISRMHVELELSDDDFWIFWDWEYTSYLVCLDPIFEYSMQRSLEDNSIFQIILLFIDSLRLLNASIAWVLFSDKVDAHWQENRCYLLFDDIFMGIPSEFYSHRGWYSATRLPGLLFARLTHTVSK